MELTRKRQGQNIYELFGRACPSCGGLGHVAVLPGKDLLQAVATASGLVRSAASARAEVVSPLEAGGNGRRRRGGRGRASADVPAAAPQVSISATADADPAPEERQQQQEEGSSSAAAAPTRRPEPELVAVPMTPEQQEVYGWLGLNPALLLESQPESDHVLVRVVRPGEDPEAVLDEAVNSLQPALHAVAAAGVADGDQDQAEMVRRQHRLATARRIQ